MATVFRNHIPFKDPAWLEQLVAALAEVRKGGPIEMVTEIAEGRGRCVDVRRSAEDAILLAIKHEAEKSTPEIVTAIVDNKQHQ